MAGLYIHIPFCHSKCAYCDFYSSANSGHIQATVEGIIKEFTLRRDEIADPFSTIYIGGGTPSLLDIKTLSTLISSFPNQDIKEFTIEANPEDISKEKLQAWSDLGINRLSMGVQTFDDAQLKLIGRRHDSSMALDAIELINHSSILNYSLDLIYGLPTQTLKSWEESLERLLDIHPNHFSAYMLSYEPKTRLHTMLKKGEIEAVDDDTCVSMYNLLIEKARNAGYEHYEISNFALPGYHAVHNSNYWNYTPYLGLGPSAHSFDGKIRRFNPNNILQYLKAINENHTAYDIDDENDDSKFNDLLLTALRTKGGLDFAKVPRKRRLRLLCDAFEFLKTGEMDVMHNHLIIPEEYWIRSDSIIRQLIQI